MLLPLLSFFLLVLVSSNSTDAAEEIFPDYVRVGLSEGSILLETLTEPRRNSEAASQIIAKSTLFFISLGYLWESQIRPGDKVSQPLVRETLENVHRNMSSVNLNFERVRDLIDWTALKVTFSTHEQAVKALRENMMQVLRSPEAAKSQQTAFFIKQFESDYQNAATKLYQSLAENDFVFGQNLLDTVRRFTKNDRQKTQDFGMGVSKLIMQAVELEVAYFLFTSHKSNHQQFVRTYWTPKLQKLQEKLNATDFEIRRNYKSQLVQDINEFVAFHKMTAWKSIDKAIMQKLQGILDERYNWFHWISVAVEMPVTNSENLAFQACEEHSLLFSVHSKFTLILSNIPHDRFATIDRQFILSQIRSLPVSKNSITLLNILMKGIHTAASMQTFCEKHSLLLVMNQNYQSFTFVTPDTGKRWIYEFFHVDSWWTKYNFRIISFG